MNLSEFHALREGDRIVNEVTTTSTGTVTAVSQIGGLTQGVRIRWGADVPNAVTFAYSVQGTAWFHWRKADDEPQATSEATAPDAPQT